MTKEHLLALALISRQIETSAKALAALQEAIAIGEKWKKLAEDAIISWRKSQDDLLEVLVENRRLRAMCIKSNN